MSNLTLQTCYTLVILTKRLCLTFTRAREAKNMPPIIFVLPVQALSHRYHIHMDYISHHLLMY